MRRRDVLSLLGGAAVAWPFVARAQQLERMRRIGVLMDLVADDPEAQTRITIAALPESLAMTVFPLCRTDDGYNRDIPWAPRLALDG